MSRFLGVAVAATSAVLAAPASPASAQPCPDVEVVFARGTGEAPGVGGIGQGFVDALRSKVAPKTMAVYAVNYPATTDFPTATIGINDAANRIESMATRCPGTRMVLGGFSQGAAVMGFATAAAKPSGVVADVRDPLPPAVADHVAAVALFGKPSEGFLRAIEAPPIVIGPNYVPKTIDLCIADDPICSGRGQGASHGRYVVNGMTDQAASFAAGRI